MKLIKAFLIALLVLYTYSIRKDKNLGSSKLSKTKVALKTENNSEKTNEKTKTLSTKSKEKTKEKETKAEKKSTLEKSAKSNTKAKESVSTKETNTEESKKESTSQNKVVADEIKSKAQKQTGTYTTFDKDVEIDQVDSGVITKSNVDPSTIKDSPPVPLSYLKDIPDKKFVDLAQIASTSVYGQGVYGRPPSKIELLPVTYVKELSPAGKAALDLSESGDLEYQKLLNAGFETPKTISPVVGETPTRVDKMALQEFLWRPTDPRENTLWQNVEYNKYNNRLLDTHRYFTPARFEKNEFSNVVVHAPSNSDMLITTPSRTTIGTVSTFLSVDESEKMVDQEDVDALADGFETEHPM